jgi:hypothetical protein
MYILSNYYAAEGGFGDSREGKVGFGAIDFTETIALA